MKKYEKIIRKQPGIVTTATTQQYRLNGEISAPFLKRERVPGHTTRLTGVPRDHPSHPGGYRDPKMQWVISPFKVTVQRRACWPDIPVSTSVTLDFIPPKNIPSGLLNHTRPRPPQSITKLLRTSGASSDRTTTSTRKFHNILKSFLWNSTDSGLLN